MPRLLSPSRSTTAGVRRSSIRCAGLPSRSATACSIPTEISEETVQRHLQTRDLPDLDLVIRTSGEQRLSNFLLWQSAYTELVFVPTLWPDFTLEHLDQAIGEFRRRERRYGGARS